MNSIPLPEHVGNIFRSIWRSCKEKISEARNWMRARLERERQRDLGDVDEPDFLYCSRLLEVYADLKQRGLTLTLLPDDTFGIPLVPGPINANKLRENAQLQIALAEATSYTPHKWLLEQELKERISSSLDGLSTNERPTKTASWTGKTSNGTPDDVYDAAARERLWGLAFSGGGVRSATFCLGVLQALAECRSKSPDRNILSKFDYLSSVSGGGYIHQWLASWTMNAPDRFLEVQHKLVAPPDHGSPPRTPPQVAWLRRYSSYLTPRRGFLRADTWTMIATWFRNTFLNQIVLFSFLLLCVAAARGAIALFSAQASIPFWIVRGLVVLLALSAARLWVALIVLSGTPGMFSRTLLVLMPRRIASWLVEQARQLRHGYILFLRLLFPSRLRAWLRLLPYLLKRSLMACGDPGITLWIILPSFALCALVTLEAAISPNSPHEIFIVWLCYHKLFLIWVAYVFAMTSAVGLSSIAFFNDGGSVSLWPLVRKIVQTRSLLPLRSTAQRFARLAWILPAAIVTAISGLIAYALLPLASISVSRSIASGATIASCASGAPQANVKTDLATTLWQTFLAHLKHVDTAVYVALFGPVVFFGLLFLAIRLQLGLLGRALPEVRREWLARLGAWAALVSIAWISSIAIAGLGPEVFKWLFCGSTLRTVSALAGAALLHAVTLKSGSSSKSDGQPKSDALFGYSAIDLVGIIGAPICILLLLIITSGLFVNLLDWAHLIDGALSPVVPFFVQHTPAPFQRFIEIVYPISQKLPSSLSRIVVNDRVWLLASIASILLLFGWRVDVNEFSMAGFYRNRLARCYLGGNNPDRQPDPFLGFDDHEVGANTSLRLTSLRPTRFGGAWSDDVGLPYDGPFPIFCTTINLNFGQDLAWQQRKGASFAFTPLYSGYHVSWTSSKGTDPSTSYNAYVRTKDYAYRNGGISLSTAAAISGAALSPNMGYSSQPALAFLMTLFNVRLGWWIANPRRRSVRSARRNRPTPLFGLRYLLSELFGMASDTTNYVCLCDGGRFENMGIYELVRRRVRYILVCDAEQDSTTCFEGIGNAIAKCRTDFGVEIELDLTKLIPDPKTNFAQAHFIEGKIIYPMPPGACLQTEDYEGKIVYLKTSICGDESGDVLHHVRTSPAFPQDSTLNQWFNESLFESYRKLGQIIGQQAAKVVATWP